MDRRAAFFLVAAAACAALVPVAETGHRWVAVLLAIVYVMLAVGSWLDARNRDRIPPVGGDGP